MFKDREEAGRALSCLLKKINIDTKNAVVLALPRGGVPVAYSIKKMLNIPMDVVVSKKIGAPYNPEYAIAAMSEWGDVEINVYEEYNRNYIEQQKKEIEKKIEEYIQKYRQGRKLPSVKGKEVILVDDGIATGLTMLCIINSLKKRKPKRIIVAVPVAPPEVVEKFEKIAEIVVVEKPDFFMAIGSFYEDFHQLTDEEVIEYLNA
ncbi:MAG: phosphoribosyltransferase [Deltaproteobacteria bacterium]|nr:phosphoribosyltransferase [Deltaproteobacteria bacterium]